MRYTKWLNLRQLTGQSGRETGCGFEDFGQKMTHLGNGVCIAPTETMLIFLEGSEQSRLPRPDADEHDHKAGLVVQKHHARRD